MAHGAEAGTRGSKTGTEQVACVEPGFYSSYYEYASSYSIFFAFFSWLWTTAVLAQGGQWGGCL